MIMQKIKELAVKKPKHGQCAPANLICLFPTKLIPLAASPNGYSMGMLAANFGIEFECIYCELFVTETKLYLKDLLDSLSDLVVQGVGQFKPALGLHCTWLFYVGCIDYKTGAPHFISIITHKEKLYLIDTNIGYSCEVSSEYILNLYKIMSINLATINGRPRDFELKELAHLLPDKQGAEQVQSG